MLVQFRRKHQNFTMHKQIISTQPQSTTASEVKLKHLDTVRSQAVKKRSKHTWLCIPHGSSLYFVTPMDDTRTSLLILRGRALTRFWMTSQSMNRKCVLLANK
jgi:hypothetical protein